MVIESFCREGADGERMGIALDDRKLIASAKQSGVFDWIGPSIEVVLGLRLHRKLFLQLTSGVGQGYKHVAIPPRRRGKLLKFMSTPLW